MQSIPSPAISASQDVPPLATALRKSRSISEALAPLEAIARHSENLVALHSETFDVAGEGYFLPRYLFMGPRGGDTPLRIGIFAGIHGDEPEGTYALVKFIEALEARPQVAEGYCLSIYPICNPSGFEDNTRLSRSGKDLNREFWRNSAEPEVRLLQADLVSRSFQGIIALHTDDTADGFYGIVRGATLTRHLIEPALRAVEQFLPRDERTRIDGFTALHGVIKDCYDGVLSAPPKVRPKPFELILETAKHPPGYLKQCAFVLALKTILTEYRQFIAYASNI